MVNYYLKKVETIENQLCLAKIGYREEVLKISNQMAKTSQKESDFLMQRINEYAAAILALDESLSDARKSLNISLNASKKVKEEVIQNEDNK